MLETWKESPFLHYSQEISINKTIWTISCRQNSTEINQNDIPDILEPILFLAATGLDWKNFCKEGQYTSFQTVESLKLFAVALQIVIKVT